MRAKLKICGMRDPDNIQAAAALQPDYMGFLMYPGSKRFIGDLEPAIVTALPATIKTTGVFVDATLEEVLLAIEKYQLKAVQLHGIESPGYCTELRGKAEVIKAFGISETFDFGVLKAYENVVDYFLFDTQTPEHGGSGKAFNWKLLEGYQLQKPYFLSGGIGLENVSQLQEISDDRFYAIDVNSRFETAPAMKNIEMLTEFKKLLSCS